MKVTNLLNHKIKVLKLQYIHNITIHSSIHVVLSGDLLEQPFRLRPQETPSQKTPSKKTGKGCISIIVSQ